MFAFKISQGKKQVPQFLLGLKAHVQEFLKRASTRTATFSWPYVFHKIKEMTLLLFPFIPVLVKKEYQVKKYCLLDKP